jgi:hypothetical protein
MRRVWTSRGVLLPLLLALAASFVFLGRGGQIAQASPFNPTLTTSLSSGSAGATANINQFANFGTSPIDPTRSFPSSSVYFTPGNWGIPNCAGFGLSTPGACPVGLNEQTGTFASTTTFGLLNSQCAIGIPVGFPNGMRNSSTDPSDTIAPGASFAALNADVNPADGIPDGVEHWNTLLSGLQGAGILPATPPRERQILSTTALGTQVWVDVLTYDPGVLNAASAPLGYGTTFILENANPLNPPAPSLITDTCGLNNTISQFGSASPSGTPHRTNPASPGTSVFSLQATSQRDADQGPSAPAEPTTFVLPGGLSGSGFVNSLDTCPFQPNAGSPVAPAGAPFNGDSSEAPGDGIDQVCDPNPTVFDGSDVDADGYLNRGDNCPLVANGAGFGAGTDNQRDLGEVLAGPPVDGGPGSDSIGDDCDLNPTVPDGHFHTALKLAPTCVGTSDSDGDGWCDGTEAFLGSNPAVATSTPESLQVPGSCSDGADNDGDGSTDLNDTGCQLPLHDLSIKKVNGATAVCNPSNTVDYVVILNNDQATDQNGEISIYLDSQPSYVPGPGPSPAPGKSAGSVTSVSGATVTASGPINIDGDADVEWLTKATVVVKGGTASTTVHFNVTYPACGSGPNATAVDYNVNVDLCHANDVAPLGVNPLFGACAGGPSDGGQDRNNGNDGVVTRSVDDITK